MMTFSNAAEIITSTDIKKTPQTPPHKNKKQKTKPEKNYSTPAESGVSKDKGTDAELFQIFPTVLAYSALCSQIKLKLKLFILLGVLRIIMRFSENISYLNKVIR